jgi:hypothetical protein
MGFFKRPGEPKPDLLQSAIVPVLVTVTVKDGQGKVVAVRNQNFNFVDLSE